MSLLEIVKKFEKEGKALPHFNFANLEMLKSLSHAAENLNIPFVLGTSEGERDYIGIHHAVDLIKSYNKEHRRGDGYQLFLNADHTFSLKRVKKTAEAGFDSVVFDGAGLPFGENIEKTREAVKIAKGINKNIIVEGEIGYIGKSSRMLNEIPERVKIEPDDLPTPEQAKEFVEKTGVDMLAPAVGNIHGMFGEAKNPNLQIELIEKIRKNAGVPLVLHGGSGISDSDFKKAIKAGISLIHISTELRVAWRKSLEEALENNRDELAPYKIIPDVVKAVEKKAEEKTKLFLGII